MSRSNKALFHGHNASTTRRGVVGSSGLSSGVGHSHTKKITIRPYSKPPSLPVDYYAQTVQSLLDGTLTILEHRNASSSSGNAGSSSYSSSSKLSLSLQNAYTAVLTLVRHQYGPALYKDWMQSTRTAVERVLPSNTSQSNLLHTLPKLYQRYTDYLLLCKHVFLPLDQTHLWNAATQTAVPILPTAAATTASSASAAVTSSLASPAPSNHNSAAGATTTTSTKTAPRTATVGTASMMNLWTAGLAQFRARLVELNLEHALYEQWLTALLQDWNGITTTGALTAADLVDRHDLQSVWYLWQDLGLLQANSPLPLQQDLETYAARRGQEQWQRATAVAEASASSSQPGATGLNSLPAAIFLQAVVRQQMHVAQWPWLPIPWLCHILDTSMFQPHFTRLLQPKHFHPLMQYELAHQTNQQLGTDRVGTADLAPYDAGSAGGSLTVNTSSASSALPPIATATAMQQLWMLAARLPAGQSHVVAAICEYCKTTGIQLIASHTKNPESANAVTSTQAIQDLMDLQQRINSVIRTLPNGKELIHLKQVWEDVVNSTGNVAEALGKYLDTCLRNNKKLDSMPDHWLPAIMTGIFVPLQAKDVLEAFYRRDLAKRLLWNRVVSMDVEKQVCSNFKAECGAGYTSKMEGMFQDIDLSRENMLLYKQQQLQSMPEGGLEMEVQILTTGYWPVYPQYPSLQLPAALLQQQEQFDAHYKKKCHGRRITWQYALGHCVVRTNGFSKSYELVLSLCQALVLVQFTTDHVQLALPQLMQLTGLDDRDEMERILQSLALGKEGTRILRKMDCEEAIGDNSSSGPINKKKKPRMTVHDKDQFAIQTAFTSNQRRIRIQNILMKETKEEHDKTVEAVSRDRLYLMDAVLVRIMKARKTVMHQQLIPQVLEQVKFPASAADVKQRIESLIEREYMERDAKDRNRYNYLA